MAMALVYSNEIAEFLLCTNLLLTPMLFQKWM